MNDITAPFKYGSLALGLAILVPGCWSSRASIPLPLPQPPAQLGSTANPFLEAQEMGGEANDFVIYQHEFVTNTAELTPNGVAHLQQIAARSPSAPFPIIVEVSEASPATGQPVSFNCSGIDQMRRERIINILTAMGVPGASQRVVVGPALSPGLTSNEAEQIYQRGIGRNGSLSGGGRMGGSAGGAGGGGGGGFY